MDRTACAACRVTPPCASDDCEPMSNRNDPTSRMWAQACDLIDQAERLHRQFFQLGVSERALATWEPPVDVFEDEREVVIVVAMPGVPAERRAGDAASPARWSCAACGRCRSPARAIACASSRFPMAPSSAASRCRRARWSSARSELGQGCLVVRLRKTGRYR